MAWYYYGMGFNAKAAKDGAKKIEKKYGVKTQIKKSKDPIGGYLYKVYTSKSVG